jgi:hypothetical protein
MIRGSYSIPTPSQSPNDENNLFQKLKEYRLTADELLPTKRPKAI